MVGSLRKLLLGQRAASRYKDDSDFVFTTPLGESSLADMGVFHRCLLTS
jgi:hypothetical protein